MRRAQARLLALRVPDDDKSLAPAGLSGPLIATIRTARGLIEYIYLWGSVSSQVSTELGHSRAEDAIRVGPRFR
jgi:hypothetical protein